jgi:hypothetical protein
MNHRTIHRFIPTGPRNVAKTACGIRIVSELRCAAGCEITEAASGDGGYVALAVKGQAFDCKRCKAVIENFRKGRITA